MITWLSPDDPPERFPPHEAALRDPPGLLAAGGDLSLERLVAAYQRGIFPWYSPGQPVLWWSPDPREVLLPQEFHFAHRLRRSLRNRGFQWQQDRDFAAVVAACAAPRSRSPGTWITPEMSAAYCNLHQHGLAHSYEIWREERLVGGVYGVAVGGLFAGESMFHAASDASKVALHHLVRHLLRRGFALFDIQMVTPVTRQLGAVKISREDYLKRLAGAMERRCVF